MAVTLGQYKAHFWTWTNSWEEFKQVRGLGPMEPSWGGLRTPGMVSWVSYWCRTDGGEGLCHASPHQVRDLPS